MSHAVGMYVCVREFMSVLHVALYGHTHIRSIHVQLVCVVEDAIVRRGARRSKGLNHAVKIVLSIVN